MTRIDALRPPANHGMRVLDRSKFAVQIPVVMARLNPKLLSRIGRTAKPGDLLELRNVSRIVNLTGESTTKGLLLGREISQPKQLSLPLLALLTEAGAEYSDYTVHLGYEHWTADEVLNSVFPDEVDPPSGFAIVGHIAHMNLRDEFIPYKHLIGQVILDKNPGVRTVVNKLDSIDTVFRTFEMEVIAGEPDFEVEQHESGCRFQFDFRKVYWNSRLHSEHERLVKIFDPTQGAVCDPFAGVGPFAIPAGKKGVFVLASDLNPASYEAMDNNVRLNKVDHYVRCFNEDGRDFIRGSVRRLNDLYDDGRGRVQVPKKRKYGQPQEYTPALVPQHIAHYVMNLPASAIEFLDAFRGLYVGSPKDTPMPMIHVHCFHKWSPLEREPTETEIHTALADRVSTALGYQVEVDKLSFHDVRRVAPTKEMYCISFRLPHAVAYMQ